MSNLPASVLVKEQVKTYGPKTFKEDGHLYRITVKVRYDDQCGNKHNSFAITGDIDVYRGRRWREDMGGCIHDEVAKHFPELAPFIKWHLTSSDGPMHYVENTLYWLGWKGWTTGGLNSPPNLEYARNAAVWPELPEEFLAPMLPEGGVYGNAGQYRQLHSKGLFEQLQDPVKKALLDRLPALMEEFKRDVESLGFIY